MPFSFSKFLMKNLCGIEVMTPAPSPSRASDPTAPRWVILQSKFFAIDLLVAIQDERRQERTIADNLVGCLALYMAILVLVLCPIRIPRFYLRREANTTCIFLKLWVVESLLDRQGSRP